MNAKPSLSKHTSLTHHTHAFLNKIDTAGPHDSWMYTNLYLVSHGTVTVRIRKKWSGNIINDDQYYNLLCVEHLKVPLYARKPTSGVTGTVDLCVSYRFLTDRLLDLVAQVWVQLPVVEYSNKHRAPRSRGLQAQKSGMHQLRRFWD